MFYWDGYMPFGESVVSRNQLRNVVSREVYTANLGFVGLGVMGSRMVKRLLDAGHGVTGYNRTKSKAQWLLDAGMKWADTPRAVAKAAEITITMVTNTQALQAVTSGRRWHSGRTRQQGKFILT